MVILQEKLNAMSDEGMENANGDEGFEDAENGEPPPTTATEDERDEALRWTTLLKLQLEQGEKHLAAAQEAVDAVHAAQRATMEEDTSPAPPEESNPGDLWMHFDADPAHLPTLGTPDALELRSMQQLAAIFAAIPWGTQAPAMQFGGLDVAPGFIHSLVGDAIWGSCWGERRDTITALHWIPFKLLNIVMSVVLRHKDLLLPAQLEAGRKRYREVEEEAAKRRLGPCGPASSTA
jgi:hypothetical protein